MSLPDFIIGGERKCGTTSLYIELKKHPEIYMYPRSDMDYFIETEVANSRQWLDGEADSAKWEEEHSIEEYSNLFEGGDEFSCVGQKDADLLFWWPSHKRLRRYVPDARFIFSLRNPVRRAWSHYWDEIGKGREWLGFEDAIREEDKRSERSAYARDHLSYVSRGFYDESLARFFEQFNPSQVLVLSLEKTVKDPVSTMEKVARFLGVEPGYVSRSGNSWNASNPTMRQRRWVRGRVGKTVEVGALRGVGVARRLGLLNEMRSEKMKATVRGVFEEPISRPPIPQGAERELAERYEGSIQRLERLLRERFPEFRPAARTGSVASQGSTPGTEAVSKEP